MLHLSESPFKPFLPLVESCESDDDYLETLRQSEDCKQALQPSTPPFSGFASYQFADDSEESDSEDEDDEDEKKSGIRKRTPGCNSVILSRKIPRSAKVFRAPTEVSSITESNEPRALEAAKKSMFTKDDSWLSRRFEDFPNDENRDPNNWMADNGKMKLAASEITQVNTDRSDAVYNIPIKSIPEEIPTIPIHDDVCGTVVAAEGFDDSYECAINSETAEQTMANKGDKQNDELAHQTRSEHEGLLLTPASTHRKLSSSTIHPVEIEDGNSDDSNLTNDQTESHHSPDHNTSTETIENVRQLKIEPSSPISVIFFDWQTDEWNTYLSTSFGTGDKQPNSFMKSNAEPDLLSSISPLTSQTYYPGKQLSVYEHQLLKRQGINTPFIYNPWDYDPEHMLDGVITEPPSTGAANRQDYKIEQEMSHDSDQNLETSLVIDTDNDDVDHATPRSPSQNSLQDTPLKCYKAESDDAMDANACVENNSPDALDNYDDAIIREDVKKIDDDEGIVYNTKFASTKNKTHKRNFNGVMESEPHEFWNDDEWSYTKRARKVDRQSFDLEPSRFDFGNQSFKNEDNMPLSFNNRVAIVTGAGGGLGRTYALELAKRGAKVVVNDLGGDRHGTSSSTSMADKVVAEIRSNGGVAVANYDSVENGDNIVKTAIDNFGRIDIVINNAGILRDVSLLKMTEVDWDLIFKVHVKGAFSVTKAAWPYMRNQKYGRITVTSSNAGIHGNFGQANYAAAKSALIGFSNTVAQEGAKYGILCNAVIPTAGSRLTQTVMPENIVQALKPEYVTPLMTYLVHESFNESGNLYEAGAGWYGKIEYYKAAGIVLPNASAEDVANNWNKIVDMSAATPIGTMAEQTGRLIGILEEHAAQHSDNSESSPTSRRSSHSEFPENVKSSKIFSDMAERMKTNPEQFTGVKAVVQYIILDGKNEVARFTIDLKNQSPRVVLGDIDGVKANPVVTVADDDFVAIASGSLNARDAFMKRKLKVQGNVMILQKLGDVLMKVKKANL
ncbi:unnamed protein product [Caenorhabditis bovis]|uniref:Peroxisomal multifunctional enzyme type 2 n=1 Tax=Caenorhabditis bovis TaxID=2654633 RepID=A0A8S1FCX0_9PELO|nr:unnamed protein product [Caenorhabditis bovis]